MTNELTFVITSYSLNDLWELTNSFIYQEINTLLTDFLTL